MRTRLVLLALGGMLPLLAFGALLAWNDYVDQRERGAQAALNVVRGVSDAVDRELLRGVAGLQALALSRPLRQGDLAAFREQAQDFIEQQHPDGNVLLVDAEGRQLVNLLLPPGATLPPIRDADVYRRTVETGRPTVSNLGAGTVRRHVINIAVPVTIDGRARYVLVLSPSLASFAEILRRQRPESNWVVSIVDAAGINVARVPNGERFAGVPLADRLRSRYLADAEGHVETPSLEGVPMLASFSRGEAFGWGVAIGRPLATLEAPLHRSLVVLSTLGAASLVVAGALALRMARSIEAPIAALADRAASGPDGRAPSGIVEIDAVAARLDSAMTELHLEASRKDEFLATLAHELRNPLAPLRNAMRLLQRESLSGHGRTALEIGTRQVGQLGRLVDDLLEISRVTQGKIELRLEPVAVHRTVEQVLQALAPLVEIRGQRLALAPADAACTIEADPVRLAQIVENLVSNASKYTDRGGRIDVEVRPEGDGLRIGVRDTGIGIDARHLSSVFEPFVQIDASIARSQGGLGLGLALVKRLAELHGGRVSAESPGPGGGSTFSVWLPRGPGAAGSASAAGARARGAAPTDGPSVDVV